MHLLFILLVGVLSPLFLTEHAALSNEGNEKSSEDSPKDEGEKDCYKVGSEAYWRNLEECAVEQRENCFYESADNNDKYPPVPKRFMANERWPYCPSIATAPHQGNIMSCWAVNTAAAITDRTCIATRGAVKVDLSAYDILSCCESCRTANKTGGTVAFAWRYWAGHDTVRRTGLVTGTGFHPTPYSGKTCKDYPYPPPSSAPPHYPNMEYKPGPCQKRCDQSKFVSVQKDRRYFGNMLVCSPNVLTIVQIQREIFSRGPITLSMDMLYSDFTSERVRNGVYFHTHGELLQDSGHTVKVIGWGETDDGVPYWAIMNSYGPNWGMNGMFYMLRGANELGIERSPCLAQVDKTS